MIRQRASSKEKIQNGHPSKIQNIRLTITQPNNQKKNVKSPSPMPRDKSSLNKSGKLETSRSKSKNNMSIDRMSCKK